MSLFSPRQQEASRGGDEIWGAAVTDKGQLTGEGPVNVLLRALAEGKLTDAPLPDIARLPTFAERALNRLHLRHWTSRPGVTASFRRSRNRDASRSKISTSGSSKRSNDDLDRTCSAAETRGRSRCSGASSAERRNDSPASCRS